VQVAAVLQVSGSQVMNKRWFFAVIGLALFSLDHPAWSEATCECADMADLMNREAEERAAIKAYQDAPCHARRLCARGDRCVPG
jgi:hypothetical protein